MTEHPEQDHSNKPKADALIEHAQRMWEAETVNAERHSLKLRVIVPTGTALVGLILVGATRLPLYHAEIPTSWKIIVLIFLLVGMILLLVGILKLLFQPRRLEEQSQAVDDAELAIEAPASSYYLELKESLVKQQLENCSPVDAEIFRRILAAAIDLRTRNLGERDRMRRAQKYLVWGFVGTVAAVWLYIFSIVLYSLPRLEITREASQESKEHL